MDYKKLKAQISDYFVSRVPTPVSLWNITEHWFTPQMLPRKKKVHTTEKPLHIEGQINESFKEKKPDIAIDPN